MERTKEIEILMKDGCTRSEAVKALKRGTTIFEDFEAHFEDYMEEWGCDEEGQEIYKRMIELKIPAMDWGVVELDGKAYYIMYVL